MLNYLYYKLYQASLKSSLRDIPEFLAPVFLGGLISANILVISAFLAKLDVMPFLFANSKQGGIFALVLIVLSMLYYRKERYKPVLEKYSQESGKQRIRGNTVVALYVAISFLSIFIVAFFRPGKL
jgi:hypothetical protein